MQMNVFDVGFGESILLKGNHDSALLVDCGSKSEKNIDSKLIGEHLRNFHNKKFMLTHFHKDHYNGFDKLKSCNQKANTLYFPWLGFMENDSCAISVLLKLATYLIILYEMRNMNPDAVFLLKGQFEFIQNHVKDDGDICLLKQEDTFFLDDIEMEVIWPIYIGLEEAFDNKGHDIESIYRQIRETMFVDEKEENDFLLIQSKLMKNVEIFYSFFNRVNDKKSKILAKKSDLNNLDNLINEQNDLIFQINQNTSAARKENKDSLGKWRKQLKEVFDNDNNACSIVFRDKRNASTNYTLLMTGDVTKKVIDDQLYNNYFKDTHYRYMKCPHHGTCTHYSVCLPVCDNFIISNKMNGKYHSISDQYFFHNNANGVRYCTNPCCEIIKSGRYCQEHNQQSRCSTTDGLFKIDISD